MLRIDSFTVEGRTDTVTDSRNPRFSFSLSSDRKNVFLSKAFIEVNEETIDATKQIIVPYRGKPLKPYTKYKAKITALDDKLEKAEMECEFSTARLDTPWTGKWITCGSYSFTEKNVSPKIMTFRKKFSLEKKPVSASIDVTALGIYDLILNGKRPSDRYLAPGFTSYENQIQYQHIDITECIEKENELVIPVSGGWAVGSFVMSRTNRIYADRQALLLEIRLVYENGTVDVLPSDTSFDVTMEGPYKMADIYDGEWYDSTVSYSDATFEKASIEEIKIKPKIVAEYGSPVIKKETLKPISTKKLEDGHLIYDFGQNFAGLINLHIKDGKKGEKISVYHGEILREDGHVNRALLRTAKQEIEYTCKDGEQTYSPRFTYMGFRYIEVAGVDENNVDIEAFVLYSDIKRTGDFKCSDERLNRLNENIVWSSKSNFLDIPTDCPQRDERMGWTGDIALFSPVSTYLFEMNNFLEKWLVDLKSEQLKTGGIPTTIPHKGYGFPLTFPTCCTDFWGDAALLVPYALYMAYGNEEILSKLYPTMKKYVDACFKWASLLSFGKKRYIWHTLDFIHFGDWVAPGESMAECQSRHPYTATASLYNTSSLLSKIAGILGNEEDEKKYKELSKKVSDAYESVFFEDGRIKKKEFQTAYVLPIYFDMLTEETKKKAAARLAEMVKEGDYKIQTGFPGTPFILFALADNGYEEESIAMLLNDKCPSWLHEVVTGGTTIWERFDGLDENGKLNVPEDGTGGMISFNHYASGSVGNFLYKRILGLEAIEPAYKTFQVKPMFTDKIKEAEGGTITPYGEIHVSYKIDDNITITVKVPCNTRCRLVLPDGTHELGSGTYTLTSAR